MHACAPRARLAGSRAAARSDLVDVDRPWRPAVGLTSWAVVWRPPLRLSVRGRYREAVRQRGALGGRLCGRRTGRRRRRGACRGLFEPSRRASSKARGGAWRRVAGGGGERGGRPRTGGVRPGCARPARSAPLSYVAVRVMYARPLYVSVLRAESSAGRPGRGCTDVSVRCIGHRHRLKRVPGDC